MLRASVAAAAVLALATPAAARTAAQAAPQFADELTVWVIPAPRPAELTWRTPGGLIRRVVMNAVGGMLHIMNRKLGHMGVTLRCAARAGKPAFTWQGSMTNDIDAEFNDIIVKKGYALGVLFHNFTGRYETAAELQKSIDERYRTGRITWVRYGISAGTCARLAAWIDEFHKAGVDKYYGLASRPRYREGAGCSAFSMSFLEQAGLLERAYQPWSFLVRVPLSLVGGPITGKRIPLARAMAVTRPWARPGEPHRAVFGWDPTQAFHWMHKVAIPGLARGRQPFATPAAVERRGRAVGLVLDKRHVPTPTEPFFKK